MSLMDDPNEIELAGAIQSTISYVQRLYQEADEKRSKMVDHLWDLYKEKIGVPDGSSTNTAWRLFRDAITDQVSQERKGMFDIPESYEEIKLQRDSYKEDYLSERESFSRWKATIDGIGDTNLLLAGELLRISKMYPGIQLEENVKDALKNFH